MTTDVDVERQCASRHAGSSAIGREGPESESRLKTRSALRTHLRENSDPPAVDALTSVAGATHKFGFEFSLSSGGSSPKRTLSE